MFGCRRGGNLALLKQLGSELAFAVHGLASATLEGVAVSSTRIRDTIRAGDLALAGRLLGRPYTLEGKVIAGDQIGRQIGFPTANLDTMNLVMPSNGVYAVLAQVNGQTHPAVLNIGTRPTLNSSVPRHRVEAHLLHFSEDIYGASMEILFKARLRAEQRFASFAELKAQIARDIAAAQAVF
jgi:riboflavin kinase/FMN adenylyltransferase